MTTPRALAHGMWADVDYRPRSGNLGVRPFLPWLEPSSRVLELGCGKGSNAILLGKVGHSVVACDLNRSAIDRSRRRAAAHDLSHAASFICSDVLDITLAQGSFDAVVLIRFLTCLPSKEAWRAVLRRAYDVLAPDGLILIRDFCLDNANYGARYEAAVASGLPNGVFRTLGAAGEPLVVRHHSDDEIEELRAPYLNLRLWKEPGISMGGNPCTLFGFVGRKQAAIGGLEAGENTTTC